MHPPYGQEAGKVFIQMKKTRRWYMSMRKRAASQPSIDEIMPAIEDYAFPIAHARGQFGNTDDGGVVHD